MGDSFLPFGASAFIPGGGILSAETGEFIPGGGLSSGAPEFSPNFGSASNSTMLGVNMSAGSAEFVPSIYMGGNNMGSGELTPAAQEFMPTGVPEFIPGRGVAFSSLQSSEFTPNAGEFMPQAPEFQPSGDEYDNEGLYMDEQGEDGEGYDMMGGDYGDGMEEAEMMMPVYGPREGGWAEVCATTVVGSMEMAMNQPSSIECLAFDPLYEQVCVSPALFLPSSLLLTCMYMLLNNVFYRIFFSV
jgi:hypothetical protein